VLRQNIDSLQRSLKMLANVSNTIDDREARKALQRQIMLVNDLLLLRADELSQVEKLFRRRFAIHPAVRGPRVC
jgi:hypothetical protein